MDLRQLDGSSKDNPWQFTSRGALILPIIVDDTRMSCFCFNFVENSLIVVSALPPVAPPPRIIYKGPPSTIVQHTRGPTAAARRRAAASATAPASGSATTSNASSNLVPALGSTSSSAARLARTWRETRLARDAREIASHRVVSACIAAPAPGALRIVRCHRHGGPPRRVALDEDDLYLDDVRPPVVPDFKLHHQCSICLGLKSHPVSYVPQACPGTKLTRLQVPMRT